MQEFYDLFLFFKRFKKLKGLEVAINIFQDKTVGNGFNRVEGKVIVHILCFWGKGMRV